MATASEVRQQFSPGKFKQLFSWVFSALR